MTVLLTGAPDVELLAAVHAAAHDSAAWVVRAARWEHGYELPDLGPRWVSAPRIVRAATLVILGEAYLTASGLDAEVAVELNADRLKESAVAIAAAHDWTRRITHAELQRRRAKPGRLAREVDSQALARWVAGSSDGKGTAA